MAVFNVRFMGHILYELYGSNRGMRRKAMNCEVIVKDKKAPEGAEGLSDALAIVLAHEACAPCIAWEYIDYTV
jgi:hypothetical protein